MQRRGGSGRPVKGQRDSAIRPKHRKAPTDAVRAIKSMAENQKSNAPAAARAALGTFVLVGNEVLKPVLID
jgi:hypothetical protein